MRDEHLTAETLARLLEGDAALRNRMLLHHLSVCPECWAVGGHILDLYLSGQVDLELCTIEIALARSRQDAPRLLEEFLAHTPEERIALVETGEEFRSWGLAELLCAESEAVAGRDAGRALELAELAVKVAMSLREWEPAEQHWHDEHCALAWVHLGNAQRVVGDLPAARKAFDTADNLWAAAYEDVGDVLGYEALFLALKSSFLRAERRLPGAFVLLDQALAANPSPSLRLRILINKAKAFEELCGFEEALAILQEARQEAGTETDPRVRICLAHNFLDYLSKLGRFLEALEAYPEAEAVIEELADEPDRLRLRWVYARVAKGLGRWQEAAGVLEGVRERFAALGLRYDAVLASLELAVLYLEGGSGAEALAAVGECLPILGSISVEREEIMALTILTGAVEESSLTSELLTQVVEHLRRRRG